jgi:hypothetical protein
MRSDTSSGLIWVGLTRGIQLPTFEIVPINLGNIPRFEPDEFAWADFSDLDSCKPLESQVTLPDVYFDLAVSCAKGLGSCGILERTNPFIVVLKDGKYLGHSSVKAATRAPLWEAARFVVGLPFGCDIGDYTISFEVWNLEKAPIPPGGVLLEKKVILRRVQFVDVSRSQLSELLQPDGANVFRDYNLTSSIQHSIEQKAQENMELAIAAAVMKAEEDAAATLLSGDLTALRTVAEEKGAEQEQEQMIKTEAAEIFANGEEHSARDEGWHQRQDEGSVASGGSALAPPLVDPPPADGPTPEDMLPTTLNGQITVMGSKATYQLKVRCVYELYSNETQLSDDVRPFVIVIWNGVDIGQTSFHRNTRWATWQDSIFNIPVPGDMEPGQCELTLEVWNMDAVGGGKRLMSSVDLTSKILRDFLMKKAPFASRQVFALELPPAVDVDAKDEGKGKKKKDGHKKSKHAIGG